MVKKREPSKRELIKNDLIDQLERNEVHGRHYLDLIEDYMSLWDIKNKLIRDIKKRGVMVAWSNGPAQSGHKKNESIGELNKTNAQMLRILNDLGLKATKINAPGGDDEEM